jgi:NADH:ubiquinone oxidoreductase subunit 6 (subunit J)
VTLLGPQGGSLALLPDLTAHMPTIIFTVLALICVVSALAAATAPRIVHAAFGLMGTFFGVAGIYAMLGADFVALSQVIVYVGGILVLLVFGILLTGRTQASLGLETRPRRGAAIAVGGLVFLGLMLAIGGTEWNAVENPGDPQPTTAAIGRAFLDPDQYLIPFEVASVLLLAALVGAAYLARRRRQT